jgi:uncharacterized lipoprotein YajG
MLKVRSLFTASVIVLLASLVLIAACHKPAETTLLRRRPRCATSA